MGRQLLQIFLSRSLFLPCMLWYRYAARVQTEFWCPLGFRMPAFCTDSMTSAPSYSRSRHPSPERWADVSISWFAIICSGPWDYPLPRSRYLLLSGSDTFFKHIPLPSQRIFGLSIVSRIVILLFVYWVFARPEDASNIAMCGLYVLNNAFLEALKFHSASMLVIPFGQSGIGTPAMPLSFCCQWPFDSMLPWFRWVFLWTSLWAPASSLPEFLSLIPTDN